jgi:hypothetical protein
MSEGNGKATPSTNGSDGHRDLMAEVAEAGKRHYAELRAEMERQRQAQEKELAEAAAKVAPQPDGRDQRTGRFAKGWKGGPGNPHARAVALLRSTLLEEYTPADLRRHVRGLIVKADGGDLDALKVLFSYALGPPRPAPDPDELDVHEWRLIEKQPTLVEVVRAVLDCAPADVATEVVRQMLAHRGEGGREGLFAKAKKAMDDNPAEMRRVSEMANARAAKGGRR